MKIVFLQKKYVSGSKIPETNYGCSYSIYSTPDLSMLYLAAVAQHNKHETTFHRFDTSSQVGNGLPSADIYLLHSVYLSKDEDIDILKHLRKERVYIYGPAATLHPEDYLLNPNHYVLRGEIEHIFAKAINEPQKTPGVSWKNGKVLKHNITSGIIEDLDSIPLPVIEPYAVFRNPKLDYEHSAMILASRGCIGQCKFCVPNSISWARELEWKRYRPGKPPVKFRSVGNVLKEIGMYLDLGINNFSFIDDQFIISKKQVAEFSRKAKPLNIKYGILARCDKLLDPIVSNNLASSGCVYADLGVESFDQDVLDDIGKTTPRDAIYKSIENLRRSGVEPKLNIMFGTSSLENEDSIEQTISETLKLPVKYCMYSIATPFEGTELYQQAKKNNWIKTSADIDPIRSASIDYPHLKAEELEQVTRRAYRRFYFRPRLIFAEIWLIMKSPRKLVPFIRSLINFFKK